MGEAARATAIKPDLPEQHSPLLAILPYILRTFRREPALALTVCYLFVALAGIYYDYGFYERGFGIPVLTLAQAGDFLVAGLQQPMALVLLISTLPLCWIFDWFTVRNRRKDSRRRERLRGLTQLTWRQKLHMRYLDWHLGSLWTAQLAYAAIVVLYGWSFVLIYAGHRVDQVKQGAGQRVSVRLNGEAADLRASDGAAWSYLGAVSNYVFVYDHVAGRAVILPVNAIARIQPEPSRGKPDLAPAVVHLP